VRLTLFWRPSATCTLNITFSPALGSSGTINGAVVITDNAVVNQQILDAKGTSALPLTFCAHDTHVRGTDRGHRQCRSDCYPYQQSQYLI